METGHIENVILFLYIYAYLYIYTRMRFIYISYVYILVAVVSAAMANEKGYIAERSCERVGGYKRDRYIDRWIDI